MAIRASDIMNDWNRRPKAERDAILAAVVADARHELPRLCIYFEHWQHTHNTN